MAGLIRAGSNLALLPAMETDVTLRSIDRTIVIECKYTESLYQQDSLQRNCVQRIYINYLRTCLTLRADRHLMVSPMVSSYTPQQEWILINHTG